MSEEDVKKSKLLEANTRFYRAFIDGDFRAMEQLWATEDVSCIHPGWPVLVGRPAVIDSWRDILKGSDRPPVQCRGMTPMIHQNEARVLCLEIVGELALAATNQFRYVDGEWRMLHHQASLVGDAENYVTADGQAAPRRLH